jgi:hypothetical protein
MGGETQGELDTLQSPMLRATTNKTMHPHLELCEYFNSIEEA